jgi:hypothetical protein
MVRKTLYMSAVICLLLAVVMPANVAMAQKPVPPVANKAQVGAQPQIDLTSLPEVVQKAAQLQKSLSPSQQDAVRKVLDQYRPVMLMIASADMASNTAVAAPAGFQQALKEPAVKQPEAKRVDQNQAARMAALLSKIDAGMAAILNADQLALYRAVMKPDLATKPDLASTVANGLKPAGPDPATKPDSATSPQGSYTSYCFYGAYYDAYTKYYAYYGYVYGYYDYYYNGTTNGYYAYLYGYYGYTEARTALDYSAPTYFGYYYTNLYTSGYPYNAYYYSYYAEYYEYYAYYYAYYDYYNTGTTYAYYAYYYDYYGYSYSSNARYYTYYCYYYS